MMDHCKRKTFLFGDCPPSYISKDILLFIYCVTVIVIIVIYYSISNIEFE